jgi:Leucine-rich repeat (LRR) protein
LLTSLQKLTLTQNKLHGSIPSQILHATSLQSIHLNDNKLTSMPNFDTLALLSSLRLGTNLLVGTFPALPIALKELDLSFNALSGIYYMLLLS